MDREQAEEFATNASDAVVMCRANSHAWVSHTVSHNRRHGTYTIVQRCSRRCRCLRSTVMDHEGYTEGWSIAYPTEGYLVKGQGRMDRAARAAIRLATLRSLTVTEVEVEDGG